MHSARRVLSVTALVAAPVVAGFAVHAAQQQAPPPVIGRWDLTVTELDFPACAWLEVEPSGNRMLVGRFVGWWGSARPVSRVEFADGVLRLAIPPQFVAVFRNHRRHLRRIAVFVKCNEGEIRVVVF